MFLNYAKKIFRKPRQELHIMFRILNLTSPEIWKKESYDSKSDIWALGCVLYEMISLFTPF